MARARHLRPQGLTEIDDIRDNLTTLERSLPSIQGTGRNALKLLHGLDIVHDRMASLQQQGADPRAERARLESIEGALRGDRAAALVREVRRGGGWELARASVTPERDRWWWYLDEELARRRRSHFKHWLSRGAIMLAILGLLAGAYQAFLAPSPQAEQKLASMQEAERYTLEGDLEQAIASYEQAAALDPGDPEPQVWLGILYEQVGRREDALRALRSARQSIPAMVDYFLMRGRAYLALGMLDQAGQDILAAQGLDPHSDQALLLLADVLERQGAYTEALALFQHVSVQAEDPSLQVLAKMRYGMLLQSGPRVEMDATAPDVEETNG